jgi:zinc transport system substrate-binding protein
MTIKKIALLIVLTLIVGATIFGITASKTKESSKLSVVASFYPLYDFAKHVGGDKVEVTNVTPAGAEPHEYEPSPQMLVTAQKSDVFIFNGEWLEPWTDNFIKDYKGTLVMGGDGISLLKNNDPHFWLDPVLAQKMVNSIRDGLIKADPANKEYYSRNAKSYVAKLADLDQAYRSGLGHCDQRAVVVSHDALEYLANRYDFETLPIAGISPEEEPSAARLAELSKIVKEKGIKYVFFESLVSPRLADTIAQETGAKTLVFDPLEGLSDADQKQGKDYLSVQRENLENLRSALACS